MGKSNIVREFELIATRIYNQKMRENQFLVRLGTWVKVLQDENREMKKQIAELEIRLKKLNDYGPTLLTRSEANQQEEISPNQRITPGQLKHFRMSRKLSQNAIAAILGVKAPKYARWESGKSIMTIEIENAIRELMQLKASEMRTKLQSLGLFQNTGKKTKHLRGQEFSEPETSKPEKKQTAPVNTQRSLRQLIITKEKLRELRLKLGYSQPQMAGLFSAKPKDYANWEYGQCRPPEDMARKYLALYLEHFPDAEQAPQLPAPQQQTRKYKICESPELPMLVIREARRLSGKTTTGAAEALGVPLTTYKNWESGRSRPNGEKAEKFKQVFADFLPTAFRSIVDMPPTQPRAVKKKATKKINKISHSADDITAEQMQSFRRSIGMSQQQMATLLGITLTKYSNWETRGRRVAFEYRDAVKELMTIPRSELKAKMEAAGITEMQGRPVPQKKNGGK